MQPAKIYSLRSNDATLAYIPLMLDTGSGSFSLHHDS
jgi:hypothetical protein